MNRVRGKKGVPILITLGSFVFIICLSIGYAAFNNNLFIGDISANIRIDKDARIMGIRVNKLYNASSNYEEYNASNITSHINLISEDAYVIYDVDVYNLGNVMMAIKGINSSNDKLKFELLNYNLNDKICEGETCLLGAKKTIQLKVSYKDGAFDSSSTAYNMRLDFEFARVYSVMYRNISGSDSFPTDVIEGGELRVTFASGTSSNLVIVMNDKFLSSGVEYSYSDNNLVIPNVNGNIVITLQGMTEMKKNILSNFVTSGNENDVPLYDFGAMSHDERKNMFSNIETAPSIFRTNGIKGESDAIVFRGNVTNNYVRFAGYYWRILQIDEDGNIRIILNDAIDNDLRYRDSSDITSIDDAEELFNYKNSNIKSVLDNWTYYYEPWKDKVVTSKFCSDLNYVEKVSSDSKNLVFYFHSYQSIGSDVDLYDPTLTCEKDSLFDEDIGMISAEEYVLAGGAFKAENKNFFLYNANFGNSKTWTLSPSYYDTSRSNGDLFIIDNARGMLTDYHANHLAAYNKVRPVITLNGDYNMIGDGTIGNPYRYEGTKTAELVDITDLSSLDGNSWYIGSVVSRKGVYGVMSGEVSTKLDNVNGLLGKGTAYFNQSKHTLTNFTGITFEFVNGSQTDDGYLYEIKSSDGRYLRINSDNSIELTNEESKCLVKLVNDTSESSSKYNGSMIMIMNEEGNVYLNFYGSNSGSGDDKFAGWNELDLNAYISLFRPDNY